MVVIAFDRRRLDLQNLHRDIDKLLALTTTLCYEGRNPGRDTVANARAIYGRMQSRLETIVLSPEEESVIDLKMNRLRTRLLTLADRYGTVPVRVGAAD
jgi:hypothetical protein